MSAHMDPSDKGSIALMGCPLPVEPLPGVETDVRWATDLQVYRFTGWLLYKLMGVLVYRFISLLVYEPSGIHVFYKRSVHKPMEERGATRKSIIC